MASLLGFRGDISGASGSQGFLSPQGSWRVYIFPRGGHASQASTGTLITFDSADVASRFAANNWIQVGTDTAKITQVSAVGGNSIAVTAAQTVALNERVHLIGATQPTVSGGSATYTPNTLIRLRDDDAATLVTNSMLTTNSNGLFQYFAANGLYDGMVQDSNQSNQLSLVDMEIGVASTDLLPDVGRSRDIGTCALPWDDIRLSGVFVSAVTSATGVTSHRFNTCGGVTQGNLFHFANNGTVQLYGDTAGGVFHSYSLPRVYNVKSARFGAVGGNNSAVDDTTPIQNALNAAATDENGSQGSVVFCPRDTYHISTTLEVPASCRLVGEGRRGTRIRAGDSFTSNTFMVRLGTATEAAASTNAHGTQVEHMWLDANTKVGSCGVHSTRGQEGSGLFDVLITNYRDTGVSFGDACQNMRIVGAELYGDSTGEVGIRLNRVFGPTLIQDVTVGSNNGVSSTNPCILVSASVMLAQHVHGEYHSAVFGLTTHPVGGGGAHTLHAVDTANGVAACDTVIDYFDSSGAFVATQVRQGTASSIINDRVLGTSVAGVGAVQFYHRSSIGTNEELFAPGIAMPANYVVPNFFRFGCTTSFDRAVGFTQAILSAPTDVAASSDSISVSTANWLRIGGAGTINITSLTNGFTGQRMEVTQQAGAPGTYTFIDGNTLFLAGNFALGAMDSIELRCFNGTSWYEISRSNN